MNVKEAASILTKMYRSAAKGDTAVSVHLFGIQYADQIEGLSLAEILAASGIPQTYQTEVRKGIKLSRFVQMRKSY